MPEIGEIKLGREIGKPGKSMRYIWRACEDCGKERWIATRRNVPVCVRCYPCSRKIVGDKNWKGGRCTTKDGYIEVFIHPEDLFFSMAMRKHYILEHRLMMAKQLRRCLHPWEHVHHKNGVRNDNRIENLEVTTPSQHHRDHAKGYKDGYIKGLKDGKDKRVKNLENRVTLLESENTLLKFQTGIEV